MVTLRQQVSKYHPVKKQENPIWLGMTSPYFGIDDLKWFLMQVLETKKIPCSKQSTF